MDIGALFKNSWDRFVPNIGMAIMIYLVGGLIAGFLSGLTLGIVGIPIMAGMIKVYRQMQQGGEADFGMLFSEFSNFGKWFKLWLFYLVLGIIMTILCFLIIGYLVMPVLAFFLFFQLPLMVDTEMGPMEAAKASFNKIKSDFGGLIGPILLVALVSYAGSLAFGIGVLFTAPYMMIATWFVYDYAFGGGAAPAADPPPSE